MIATNKTMLILLASAFLASCSYIDAIDPPVADPEEAVLIAGNGFGLMQGDGYVSFSRDGAVTEVHEVIAWSNREIRLALPPEVGSSHVRVHVDLPLSGPQPTEPAYLVVRAEGLPSATYGYEVPVEANSPWPSFRRTRRNTGRSPIQAVYGGDEPWSFETAKGIFSTPIIGGDGTVYVGSADYNFYAINPDGSERWTYRTGELIDSAATITRFDPDLGYSKVVFLSGDGNMYCLRTDDGVASPEDRLLWTFQATADPGPGYNNWWEGNVVMGFDGTLYAGNTNWNYYAVDQEGALEWTYTTGNNAWSAAAFADDGTIYWGSLDLFVHAVGPDAASKWRTMTLGFISSSAAVGSDGTVYIGSFDSALYALEPEHGRLLWKFPTMDHIYTSPALGVDDEGNTDAIYFGSADGIFYALDTLGGLLWTYDTGDTIRSSPTLGPAPPPEVHDIVYFGCGNGKLYALNSDDGTRRWSYDTTPDDAELADRNDLNGSPALGEPGVYIGGEHGFVWYLPYDYCLYSDDSRCETDPGETFDEDGVEMFYVTPGGNTLFEDPETLPASTYITERLVVREAGDTVDAAVCSTPIRCPCEQLDIDVWPPFDYHVEPSADGHYLHIVPEEFLEPGTSYNIFMEGAYLTGGLRIGNLVVGGTRAGSFSGYVEFDTDDSTGDRIPLEVTADEVSAFEWKRLAAPLPPMLPSLNQIGFDSYHWILGTLEVTEPDAQQEGKFLMWAVGGRFDDEGLLVADPATDFTFPMNGRYKNDFFILSNTNFTMEVTDVAVPFDIFQLRGQLGPDLRAVGASAYAEADCLSVPTFGPLMALAGLCNGVYEKLVAFGTYITRAYDPLGPANKRPEGIAVASLDYTPPAHDRDGTLRATFALGGGAAYSADEHLAGLVLIDTAETEAVNIDYHAYTTIEADAQGNIAAVTLTIPAGTDMPGQMKGMVILDVFPFYEEVL